MKPILVLGVGNLIQQDDGVGVHVVQRLHERGGLPNEVELFDGGTAGLDLIAVLHDRRQVIVIDAVDGGQPPGTLFRFTPDDIPPDFTGYDSIHQLGLIETFNLARVQGLEPPDAVILGVQPAVVDWGLELTPTVEAVMPRLLELVGEEIHAAVGRLAMEGGSNQRHVPRLQATRKTFDPMTRGHTTRFDH